MTPPSPRPRHEYALALVAGAAGAAGVLLCAHQEWARAVLPAPRPLPASSVAVTGQALVPLASALAVAALAGLAAVIATRGRVRRLVGVVLAVFGATAAVAVSVHVSTADVLAAARAAGISHAGSATAGGTAGLSPGGVPGGTLPAIGAAGRVMLTGSAWRLLAIASGGVVAAAGLFTAWRGARWPAMSSRYERAAARAAEGGAASMWESLSRGVDPTGPPAENGGPSRAGTTRRPGPR